MLLCYLDNSTWETRSDLRVGNRNLKGSNLNIMASAKRDTDDEGSTELHEIARSCDSKSLEDVQEELLDCLGSMPKDAVRDVINRKNVYGYTPLMELLSCHEPSVTLLRVLIEHGCNVNIADHLQISSVHKVAAKLFVIPRIMDKQFLCSEEKEIIDQQTSSDIEVFKQLIDSGADIGDADIFGRNSLFVSNDVDLIRHCFAHGADVYARDRWGRSLLHTAITMPNYKQLMDLNLPKLRPDIIQCSDVHGSTALHYAALLGRDDIRDDLIRQDVDPYAMNRIGQTSSDIFGMHEVYIKLKKLNEVHFNDVMQAEDLSYIVNKPKSAEELCHLLNNPNYGGARNGPESFVIKETIVRLAQKICSSLGEIDKRFECTLFRTGSSEEGTKVGDPNEFAFVFCLDRFAEMCDIEEVTKHKGFAELKAHGEIPPEFSAFFDSNQKCSATEVRCVFGKLLRRIVVNKPM
ncbi:poly [ADP-ribose] polymerase tankyrase-2-like [Dreissena polymorpha]|nr:poly [ADP-ribose] polymerase tankyrase-2-like [Dreissena polymorpha]